MYMPMLSAKETVSSSSGHAVLIGPFPGEEPSVESMLAFLRGEHSQGYRSIWLRIARRFATSPHLIVHHGRLVGLLSGLSEVVETTPTANGMKHNLSVRQARRANDVRAESLAAAKIERQNSLAQSIDLSMQKTAPLRLARLQDAHRITGHVDAYDGIEMWKDIAKLATSVGLHDELVDHDRVVERMRDEPLPDGCCVDDFTDKVNDLVRNHAPFMERPFANDSSLAKFIIRLMPEKNFFF